MNAWIGVLWIIFAVLAVGGFTLTQKMGQPIRFWRLFVAAFATLRLMAFLTVPAWSYWLVFAVEIGILVMLYRSQPTTFDWREDWRLPSALVVGYWIPVMAFAFNPTVPFSGLFFILPMLACTYIPLLRRPFSELADTFQHGYEENTRILKAAEERKMKRVAWLEKRKKIEVKAVPLR